MTPFIKIEKSQGHGGGSVTGGEGDELTFRPVGFVVRGE